MKKILLPQKAMITPKNVLEKISKFDYINKSPYSKTYYNVPGITWDYKPEGSLRISDHWNFKSNGSRHCVLDYTEDLIENYWMLAKYIDGKYHVLEEFGSNVAGYRFSEVSKKDLELIKDLYEIGCIVNLKKWNKKYQVKPKLVAETHTKNKKLLSKSINSERLNKFMDQNKNVKKIVYIKEQYMDIIEDVLNLYKNSSEFDELCKSNKGVNELINTYKAYKFKNDEIESFEKIYILILDNTMAINFTIS